MVLYPTLHNIRYQTRGAVDIWTPRGGGVHLLAAQIKCAEAFVAFFRLVSVFCWGISGAPGCGGENLVNFWNWGTWWVSLRVFRGKYLRSNIPELSQ
jgi:hypothetical protein